MSESEHPWYPLLIHPTTEEPYLRLPIPHSRIILTPPRPTDAAELVPLINHPDVFPWIGGDLAKPQTVDTANWWLDKGRAESKRVLQSLDSAETIVDGFPLSVLRETGPSGELDGSEIFLGDFTWKRHKGDGLPEAEKAAYMSKNNERKAGDPEIVWDVGCRLLQLV